MESSITIALVGSGSAVLGAIFQQVIHNVVRSKEQKERDLAEAEIAKNKADLLDLEVERKQQEAEDEEQSKAWRMVDILQSKIDELRAKNIALLKEIEEASVELHNVRMELIAEREHKSIIEIKNNRYKSFISKLVDIVRERCPDVSLAEHQSVIDELLES
jgi:multidrug resistance efflux pump